MTQKAGRWLRLSTLAAALVVAVGVLAPPAWAPERNFAARADFTKNDTGNIAIVGNTLMSCDPADTQNAPTTCAQAQAGTAPGADNNNNEWNMVRVDEDGDPATTLNSSRATLDLPDGAKVLFAGLYYGALSGSSARNTVKLKVPRASAYDPLTASVDNSGDRYQGFVDVTDEVSEAGEGDYWVGDVQANIGKDRYAGWALVVGYRDTSQPARNLTVFDGFKSVLTGSSVALTLSGFKTPPVGPVRTRLGVVTYEGDAGTNTNKDTLTLNTTTLPNADNPNPVNPADNFFNSTISVGGAHFTAKLPDNVNQLGFDADLVDANGVIPPDTKDAKITLASANEQYFPGVVTFATELFAPSVQASKTVTDLNGGLAQRGDTLRYAVMFTNTGQDGADNFVATDLLPHGTTYVPGSLQVTGPNAGSKTDAVGDDQAEFSANLNGVVFRLGTGATGSTGGRLVAKTGSSSFSFDVTVNTDLPNGFEVVNKASASFLAQSLGTALTSISNEVTTIIAAPDLTVTKTHTGDFVPGQATPFTLTVSNVGAVPTDGTLVTLDDVFPPSAFSSISVDVTGTGWSCSSTATTTLHCERSDVLAPGASYPSLVVSAVVADPAPATIENTATVAGGGDSNPTNNHSTDTRPVTPRADLAVTKTVAESAVPSGGEVTFNVTVRNAGPSTATGVALTDTLGPDYTNVTASPSQGACTTAVVCMLGSLAANATATITIAATVTANNETLTNTASVTSATFDPVPEDNTASADFVVEKTIDLVLAKTVTESPNAGQPDGGTYTITVRNNGPFEATNVGVADTIPLEFTPSSVTPPAPTCNLPGPGEQLSCAPGTLDVGEEVMIRIVGTFSATSAGTPVTNGAAVQSDEAELTSDDNADVAVTVPIPSADLELQKTATPVSVLPGGQVVFTLTLLNNGPSPAAGVSVTDSLPPELTFVSSPDCTAVGNDVTCAVGALAVGETRTLAITAEAAVEGAGETLTNTATATSATPDPVTSNNSGIAQFVVQNATDLQLTKTVTQSPIAGLVEGGTYTLTVRNAGPIPTATNLTVVDQLPTAFTPSSVTAPGFTCNLPGAGGELTCSRPTLTIADGEVTITVVGTFAPGSAGATVVNDAIVDGDEEDPVSENDEAAAETVPVGSADLALTKTASATTVLPGATVVFTLALVNNGPSDAGGVTVSDTLPAGLAFVSSSDCTAAANVVTCAVGALPAGGARAFTVNVVVAPTAAGQRLTNGASTSSTTPDPVGSNNAGSASVNVISPTAPPVVPTAVDVAVDVRGPTGLVREGGTAAFRIDVTNRGPATATSVVLTGTANRAVRAAVIRLLQEDCTRLPLRCDLGTLAPGQRRSFTVRVRRLVPGRLTLTASVTAAQTETTRANNMDRASIQVRLGRTTLGLSKRPDTGSAQSGSAVAFTIVVRNKGSIPARGLVVCDRLPNALAFERLGGARLVEGRACWALRRLAPGATARYHVVTTALNGAHPRRVTNVATVRGANVAGRCASASVRVRPAVRQRPPFTG